MRSTSSHRAARIRRALTTSAAAVAVVLAPTACDYAAGSPAPDAPQVPATDDGYGSGGGYGYGAGHDHGAPVVVPVASTTTPGAPADQPPAEEPPAERAGEASAEDPPAEQPPAENRQATAPATSDRPQILGDDCTGSSLDPHDGFQRAPRCVSTAFGEVAAADRSPSLLITSAPTRVKSGEAFTITVSTRNLVRDRFLGAAVGGYYLESSFLNSDGIQRGHFHTACRMLSSTDVAPDAAPAPAFFVATQDNGGGTAADSVTISVPGLPGRGTAQCAVWAGDGSHRVPMMERANQTPAFDAVRVTVK
jgi:hypothetical protein